MEYIDYVFLCPKGATVYTDNTKVRGETLSSKPATTRDEKTCTISNIV